MALLYAEPHLISHDQHGTTQEERQDKEPEEKGKRRDDIELRRNTSFSAIPAFHGQLPLTFKPQLNPAPFGSFPSNSSGFPYSPISHNYGSQSQGQISYVAPPGRSHSFSMPSYSPYSAASVPTSVSPDRRPNVYAATPEPQYNLPPTSDEYARYASMNVTIPRGENADASVNSSPSVRDFSQTSPVPRETLDKSFKVRNNDYKKFFTPGRVFSTLLVEPWTNTNKDDVSTRSSLYYVAFGEPVFCKIRRFVVVRQDDRYCTCVPVTTYASRGVKKGLRLQDHGLIYSHGEPERIPGIEKKPLKVVLSRLHEAITSMALINYAQAQTVQLNWRVKDVGRLDGESLRLLKKYFREANFEDCDEDPLPPLLQFSQDPGVLLAASDAREDANNKRSMQEIVTQPSGPQETMGISTSTLIQPYASTLPLSGNLATSELSPIIPHFQDSHTNDPDTDAQPVTNDTAKDLGPSFTFISKPHRFFVLGRVFKTLWTEPLGSTPRTPLTIDPHFHYLISYSQYAFSKIRRFVVIRSRPQSCLCLPLFTYSSQGVSKTDVQAKDHAAVYAIGDGVANGSGKMALEEGMEKEPFGVIVEEKGEKIDPMTRINFAQVYTVQHNVRVKRVGRVTKEQIERLNRNFVESVMSM